MSIFFSLFTASGVFGRVTVSTPVYELGLDLVGIDAMGHLESTLEGAVPTILSSGLIGHLYCGFSHDLLLLKDAIHWHR